MEDQLIVVVVVSVAVAAIAAISYFAWYFSASAATRRELRARKRVDIGSVADGATVKISGTAAHVKGLEPLTAPLSGRPCVCWEVVVEEQVRTSKSSSWREIVRDQRAQRFVIEDGTGRALVEARTPTIALHQDDSYRSGTFNDATPELEAFLERYDLSSTGTLGFNKQLRYCEGVIEAGERVSAFGRARLEPDPDGGGAGYRKAAMRVVIEDPEEGVMLLSDDESTTG
jgi:hypothetical protein